MVGKDTPSLVSNGVTEEEGPGLALLMGEKVTTTAPLVAWRRRRTKSRIIRSWGELFGVCLSFRATEPASRTTLIPPTLVATLHHGTAAPSTALVQCPLSDPCEHWCSHAVLGWDSPALDQGEPWCVWVGRGVPWGQCAERHEPTLPGNFAPCWASHQVPVLLPPGEAVSAGWGDERHGKVQ